MSFDAAAPPKHQPRVQLSLHAYPTVAVDGRVLPLKLKHGLALIAYLAEHRRPVGRDALAALLWPDARPGLGRGRLRRLVHELHGVLGVGVIDGDADALRISPDVDSDLARTRAALAAADLRVLVQPHAADVLSGFSLGSDAFDDWLDARRREQRAAVVRALERGVERALHSHDSERAEQGAQALLRHEPCAELGHAARLQARAARGDAAGVEAAYFDAARHWREELGLKPSARIEAAYATAQATLSRAELPFRIAYAPTRHGQVAHTSWGEGPDTLVLMWGLMSNLEVGLDEPRVRDVLRALARRHRVVMIDRRGMGLSERVGVAPDAATACEDVTAVLDRLGLERAWLFGCSAGGTMAMDIALRRPDRVAGLLLYGTSPVGHWTPETPWGLKPEGFDHWVDCLSDPVHYDKGLRLFAPTRADDRWVQHWYARLLRHAASRVGVIELLRAFHAVDLRSRLHAIGMPTLVMQRQADRVVPAEAGEYLARAIPRAQLERLEGEDHFLWYGDAQAVVNAIERFVARHAHAGAARVNAA